MIYKDFFLCRTGIYYGSTRDIGAWALYAEANHFASRGIFQGNAEVQIGIPDHMDKSRINSIRNHMKRGRAVLEEKGFTVGNLRMEGQKSSALAVPCVTVTMIGEHGPGKRIRNELTGAHAGQDILLAGWAGLEGMLRVMGEREPELRERFTPAFIRQIKAYEQEICGLDKAAAAEEDGICVVRQISDGGIFAALWKLAEETGLGIESDLKKFAVLQETIEVCELYRLNPYQLTSNGSFLMLSDCGETAAASLKRKGIQAAVIGRLTEGNDKIIYNGEDVRYIDRPAADELMKVFRKEKR